MTELEKDLHILRVGFKELEKELDFYRTRPREPGDKFLPVMSEFIRVVAMNLSEIEDTFQEMKQWVSSEVDFLRELVEWGFCF